MTDLEKLKNLLTNFGVGFSEFIPSHSTFTYIKCETDAAKVNGYNFFYTEFKFSAKGEFIEMGAFES